MARCPPCHAWFRWHILCDQNTEMIPTNRGRGVEDWLPLLIEASALLVILGLLHPGLKSFYQDLSPVVTVVLAISLVGLATLFWVQRTPKADRTAQRQNRLKADPDRLSTLLHSRPH